MILAIVGHKFEYEVLNICRMFFFGEKFQITDYIPDNDYILASLDNLNMCVRIVKESKTIEKSGTIPENTPLNEYEVFLSRLLHDILLEFTGYEPRWGILTGIRPIKLIHKAIENNENLLEFQKKWLLNDDMMNLAVKVAQMEQIINAYSSRDSFSLYISIPFCPSRCSYCSFVCSSIEHAKKVIEPYLEKLHKEIIQTGRIAKLLNLRLDTIYMGGGTPTTLSANQLENLFDAISKNFNIENILEYTVEAGRPDTIDKDKLSVIKQAGVTRLSINPQTLCDDVLKGVGRTHTAQDVIDCYQLASRMGFDNINMDLIAGLPGDSIEGFKYSVDGLIELSPANITVHTLTLKRSSNIFQENIAIEHSWGAKTTKMVDYARSVLINNQYNPYYLYRQKNTIANLENIGYSKRGYEGMYNVYIMDEIHTILSVGAGAVTKLRLDNNIERICNFKYPFEYINQFDEMISRKKSIEEFYGKYNN